MAYKIDWQNLETTFPYVPAMKECIQDGIYHAEGDVWTHTKMVLNEVNTRYPNNLTLQLAALYHDITKPATRIVEFVKEQNRDVVRHPKHATKSAEKMWFDLWQDHTIDLSIRLEAYFIIMWHQKVFHMWENEDMIRAANKYACMANWENLINFAVCDNAGRFNSEKQKTEDNLNLLSQWIKENNIGQFPNDHARLFYFEKEGRDLNYNPPQPSGSDVIILCGVPASGKDYYIEHSLSSKYQIVSLDAIRERLNIKPTENQSLVVETGFAEAKECLRKKQPFIWNATSVSRLFRRNIISVCRDYDAYVSIHAFDKPLETILKQNNQRSRHVPEEVIMRMARNFEPPTLMEAHEVKWIN